VLCAQICNCFETVNLAAADALAEVLSRRGFNAGVVACCLSFLYKLREIKEVFAVTPAVCSLPLGSCWKWDTPRIGSPRPRSGLTSGPSIIVPCSRLTVRLLISASEHKANGQNHERFSSAHANGVCVELYKTGRTDVNASDVLCALSSLGSAFSRVIQDAEAFEIPFAHTLPLRLQIRRLAKVSSEACFFLTSKWSETHTCSLGTHLCCRRIESACFS
jgi:hypothetical protein